MNKAIFLDRDGVILELPQGNELYGFTYKKEDCRIISGVPQALTLFKDKGYLTFVVTNQPAVARGLVSYEDMERLHEYVNAQVADLIDQFYFCPHHPEMHDDVPEHARKYRIICECRKPSPGMIFQAAKDFDIDLRKSWMIGDMITDIAAGRSAGCRTIMLESPTNNRIIISATAFDKNIQPDYQAKDILDSLRFIP